MSEEVDLARSVPSRLEQVAASSGRFLHTRRDWIHRRVQRISFTPSGMTITDVSIDFSLPDDFPVFEELDNGYGVYFVPLLVLRKWPPLLRLDLRDQHGEPIPLLTTRKNQGIDAKFLVASAPAGGLRDAAAPLLAEIPFADAVRAAELREAIVTLISAHYSTLSEEQRDRWAETLRLGASLGSNMLFWARVTARPSERIIVKVSYELPPGASREHLHGSKSTARRFLASLSWAPMRLVYVWHDMSGCTAYHVQLEPPDGLEVHRASLQMVSSESSLQASDEPQAKATHRLRDLWWSLKNTVQARWWYFRNGPRAEYGSHAGWPDPGVPYGLVIEQAAYMYVSGARSNNVGVAEVDLATSRTGLRRAAVAFGIGTTVFLAAISAVVPGVTEHIDGVVPALLIAPALLAVIIVNPGEHPLVRRHLTGVRLLLASVAMLPVAATISLLSFRSPVDIGELRWCWIAITLASLLLTILLGLSWLLPPVKDPADQLSAQ
jgi:hypothetical protein